MTYVRTGGTPSDTLIGPHSFLSERLSFLQVYPLILSDYPKGNWIVDWFGLSGCNKYSRRFLAVGGEASFFYAAGCSSPQMVMG